MSQRALLWTSANQLRTFVQCCVDIATPFFKRDSGSMREKERWRKMDRERERDRDREREIA